MPDLFKLTSSSTGADNQLLIESNTEPQINASDLASFDKVIKAAKAGVDLKKELDKLEDKFTDNVKNIQSRNLESLVLFTTLFSFLSISVQLYSRLENLYQALIFTCILGVIIFIMISSFFIFTRDILQHKWSVIAFFTVLAGFIIFIGVIVTVEFGKNAILIPNCTNRNISISTENCLLNKQQLEEVLKA